MTAVTGLSVLYYKSQPYKKTAPHHRCGLRLSKNLYRIKNGVWGVAPRRVAGTPVPVFTPFPGERGQGDRDNKSEVYFKNSLSLQTKKPHLITGAVLLILNLTASQDYRQAD